MPQYTLVVYSQHQQVCAYRIYKFYSNTVATIACKIQMLCAMENSAAYMTKSMHLKRIGYNIVIQRVDTTASTNVV